MLILGITEMARGTATVVQCRDIATFIICLKSFRVGALLSELDNLDHNIGPKYLMGAFYTLQHYNYMALNHFF